MVAAPRICWRSGRSCAESRYPSHGEYLWRAVAEDVCENKRDHGQAPHQERSNTFAKDHCHRAPRKANFTFALNGCRCRPFPLNERSFRLAVGKMVVFADGESAHPEYLEPFANPDGVRWS
jgi:hypothetical protein